MYFVEMVELPFKVHPSNILKSLITAPVDPDNFNYISYTTMQIPFRRTLVGYRRTLVVYFRNLFDNVENTLGA